MIDVGGSRMGEDGGGVGGVVFSRLMRCLSWAERDSGGGTGLLLGCWRNDTSDRCVYNISLASPPPPPLSLHPPPSVKVPPQRRS